MPRITDIALGSDWVGGVESDGVPVRNGVYSLETDTSVFTYKVSTITSARTEDLIGKRVISRMTQSGGYQAFGFLTRAGTLRLWTRFQEDNDKPYVKWCIIMLGKVWDLAETRRYTLTGGHILWADSTNDYMHVSLDFKFTCRVCNGRLIEEDDIVDGVHYNGVCTDHISPTQLRDEEARRERDREAARLLARQRQALVEVETLRRTGDVFPDVPPAIAARLPRSEVTIGVIQ